MAKSGKSKFDMEKTIKVLEEICKKNDKVILFQPYEGKYMYGRTCFMACVYRLTLDEFIEILSIEFDKNNLILEKNLLINNGYEFCKDKAIIYFPDIPY